MLLKITSFSYKQNVLSFNSLSNMLAYKDTVLIVKLDCAYNCQQYWALIPPERGQGQGVKTSLSNYSRGKLEASHMVSLRLEDLRLN